MSYKFKPLAQRNKDELLELLEGFDIEVPEDCSTNKLRVALLEEHGITNKRLKIMETQDERPASAGSPEDDEIQLPSDKCVVVMDRENSSYGFKNYFFSREKKYVLMDKNDADELVTSDFGFRIASVDEVMRNFK